MMLRASIFLLVATAHLLAGPIIPTADIIDWDAGVRDGIPYRATVFTNHTTDATAAIIQNSLDTCPSNQVVQLTNGTFTINAALDIPSGVTLRGRTNSSGVPTTILQGSSIAGTAFVLIDNAYDYDWNATTAFALTNCVKDSTSIGTTAAHGWSVGDIVLIDEIGNNGAGDPPITNAGSLGTATWVGRPDGVGTRCIGQIVKVVTTPTSFTATIDPPLYKSWSVTPQAMKLTGLVHYAGIEDLEIDNLTSSVNNGFQVQGGINCWARNVTFRGNYKRAYWVYGALWLEIRHCYIVGAVPIGTDNSAAYDSDRAYGGFLGPHCSAALITDNIIEKVTLAVAWEGNAAGNVFSYNFITNVWWKNTGDSPRRFGPLMHGPHPYMNLIEGNWTSDRVRADEYWGTSSHFTVARNRICQTDRGASDAQTWTVDVERQNWYWSFVGNLIGESATVSENNYEFVNGESAPYSDANSTVWKIGYNSLGTGASLYDYNMVTNTIRWGNWSYRTNDSISGSGVVYHSTGSHRVNDTGNFTIPDSYYLDSKPAFFASLSWPPFSNSGVTDASRSMTNIPAGYRYVYGEDPPSAQGATLITLGRNARIGR